MGNGAVSMQKNVGEVVRRLRKKLTRGGHL
jgi:hypothetical protein